MSSMVPATLALRPFCSRRRVLITRNWERGVRVTGEWGKRAAGYLVCASGCLVVEMEISCYANLLG